MLFCQICKTLHPFKVGDRYVAETYTDVMDDNRTIVICNKCYNTPTFEEWLHNQVARELDYVDKQIQEFRQKKSIRKYFITFTTRKDLTDKEKDSFILECHKVAKRKVFHKAIYSFEHISTNLHCHMLVESKNGFRRRDLKKMEKFGTIKFINVRNDNGVAEYIGKIEDDKSEVYTIENV